MLDFMDYIQLAFSDASGWNRDNSYSALTETANALLDFSTPERLQVNLSSLSTPQFATTYTLGTVGLIDGSISYLFSTLPLNDTPSRSTRIPLRRLVPGYRQIYAPTSPLEHENWLGDELNYDARGKRKQKDTLLHATLHLPPPTTLTGLLLRRLSPTTQLSLALSSTRATSISKSAPQASLLTQISHDTGKYSSDFLFSTDNALFGFKGLWNFGPDPRHPEQDGKESDKILSLLSAGGEAYYSPVSSVIGLSTGLRFTTLPANTESSTATSQSSSPISTFPYTLTLTLTPLTGSLSTTYSLLASSNLALSSRFGFNVYSWESEMVAGCELWRRKKRPRTNLSGADNLDWAREKMGLPTSAVPLPSNPASTSNAGSESRTRNEARDVDSGSEDSVLKVRVDQSWNVRVLWEGRVKELLVSAGVGLGPLSKSSLSSPTYAPSGGGSGGLGSYGWTSVGVSVLYSS